MNDTGIDKHDQVLMGLVFSLQAAAMQHLGKMKNPHTDAVERDLDQARATIDILEMLKVKCRQWILLWHNLSPKIKLVSCIKMVIASHNLRGLQHV